jgi:hypothetical protein
MSSSEKRLYWKVYQDANSMDYSFYVTDKIECHQVKSMLEDLLDYEEDPLPPVYVPVLMTKLEFNSLDEFDGY